MYCLGANVLIYPEIWGRGHQEFSRGLMDKIREDGIVVVVPEIARNTEDADKAMEFVKTLRRLPNFLFIPIDRRHFDFPKLITVK